MNESESRLLTHKGVVATEDEKDFGEVDIVSYKAEMKRMGARV